MNIRKAETGDLPRIMEIYAHARDFMARTGNPKQWGATNWPPEELIRDDISKGNSYVCEDEGEVVGVFYFIHGLDIDPTYDHIEDGQWIGGHDYGVVTQTERGSVPSASTGHMNSVTICVWIPMEIMRSCRNC